MAILAFAGGFAGSLIIQENRLLALFAAREAAGARWVVFVKNFADLPSLDARLRQLPGVREVKFVTKAQALQVAQADPLLAEGLKLTSRNPFPESFDIRWDPGLLRAPYLVPLAEQVQGWDGVDRVGYDRSRLDRLTLLARLGAQRRLAAAAAATAAALVLVFLAARVLFWSRWVGWKELALSAAIGAGAGAAGAGAVWGWLGVFLWHGLAAGLGVGLIAGLWKAVSSE